MGRPRGGKSARDSFSPGMGSLVHQSAKRTWLGWGNLLTNNWNHKESPAFLLPYASARLNRPTWEIVSKNFFSLPHFNFSYHFVFKFHFAFWHSVFKFHSGFWNYHLKINYFVAMFTISYFAATKVQHQFPLRGVAPPLNYFLHKQGESTYWLWTNHWGSYGQSVSTHLTSHILENS